MAEWAVFGFRDNLHGDVEAMEEHPPLPLSQCLTSESHIQALINFFIIYEQILMEDHHELGDCFQHF